MLVPTESFLLLQSDKADRAVRIGEFKVNSRFSRYESIILATWLSGRKKDPNGNRLQCASTSKWSELHQNCCSIELRRDLVQLQSNEGNSWRVVRPFPWSLFLIRPHSFPLCDSRLSYHCFVFCVVHSIYLLNKISIQNISLFLKDTAS